MDRSFGVLLHLTSLPGRWEAGGLEEEGVRRYLKWLHEAKASVWQLLPINPVGPGLSPYSSPCCLAGEPGLVDLSLLVDLGLLESVEAPPQRLGGAVADVAAASSSKVPFLKKAFANLGARKDVEVDMEAWAQENLWWLDDWALFASLKKDHGGLPWWRWEAGLRAREPEAIQRAKQRLSDEIRFHVFVQYVFHLGWEKLRSVAAEYGIKLMGDLPFFPALDSSEVWAAQHLFKLSPSGRPTVVAGVPPDYFSRDGQLWGNPVYRWGDATEELVRWWVLRVGRLLEMFDMLRIDHFRGFAACWEVPAGAESARDGRWVEAPGDQVLSEMVRRFGPDRLVAEDLGTITEDVIELRRRHGISGMAVLIFGFSPEPRSWYVPYMLREDQVVYTSTHDTNTARGWYEEEATGGERDYLRRYAASSCDDPAYTMARLAMESACKLAVIPHQDVVGLGSSGRMNVPGRGEGNWRFRLEEWMLSLEFAWRMAELSWIFGRSR